MFREYEGHARRRLEDAENALAKTGALPAASQARLQIDAAQAAATLALAVATNRQSEAIVQQTRKPPEFLIFIQVSGQSPHDGFAGQRVFDHIRLDQILVEKFQRLSAVDTVFHWGLRLPKLAQS